MATEPGEELPVRVGRDIASRLSDVLGADLLGVYLIGSGALGGFAPESSDVDVAAISAHHPSPPVTAAIVDAVSAAALDWPVRGVEFVLYPAEAAATANPRFAINLNVGRRMPEHLTNDPAKEPAHWFVLDLAILRDHGLPIAGPTPAELIGPVPRERVIDALLESLIWHSEHETASTSTVLNACRAWRFVTEGIWSNKDEAGRWAQLIANDAGLISEALAGRRAESGPELDPVRVRRFVRDVHDRTTHGGASV